MTPAKVRVAKTQALGELGGDYGFDPGPLDNHPR
jgi:hypothetical protein